MPGPPQPVYVYILECADGTLYTGWTNDLWRRLNAHNKGKGAKYTRGRGPVKYVWTCPLVTKSQALKLEARIKKLSRKRKMMIVAGEMDVHKEFEPLRF